MQKLLEKVVMTLKGDIPINPSGGLKSKGHPIGATGIGQVVEVFEQFTNKVW